jgi:hypothetical protein
VIQSVSSKISTLECDFFLGDQHSHVYLGSLDVTNSLDKSSISEKLKA